MIAELDDANYASFNSSALQSSSGFSSVNCPTLLRSSFQASATNLVCRPLAKISPWALRRVIVENNSVFPAVTIMFDRSVLPSLSHSDSMVIQSSTFPPEEMYVMLISVDTPVAKSPFDAATNDLRCQQDKTGR